MKQEKEQEINISFDYIKESCKTIQDIINLEECLK